MRKSTILAVVLGIVMLGIYTHTAFSSDRVRVLKSSTGCCSITIEKKTDHTYLMTWDDNVGSSKYSEFVQEEDLEWVTEEFKDFCLTNHLDIN